MEDLETKATHLVQEIIGHSKQWSITGYTTETGYWIEKRREFNS